MKNVEDNDSSIVASVQSGNGKLSAGSFRSGYGSHEVVEVHNAPGVEGINLAILEVISNKMSKSKVPTSKVPKTPPKAPRNRLRLPVAIARGTGISLLGFIGVCGLRSLISQGAASVTSRASPLTSNVWSPPFGPTSTPETPQAVVPSVTVEQLMQMAPEANPQQLRQLVPPLNQAMAKFGINTRLRQAHLLAQIAHESDRFTALEAARSGADYEGRKDLGNTQRGDGVKFKPRGLIQLVGRTNYAAASKALGVDLIHNPQKLADPELAALSAGWFWSTNQLNGDADKDDVRTVTRVVNGGYNGLDDRVQLLQAAKKALGMPPTNIKSQG